MAAKSRKHGSDAVLLFSRGLEEVEWFAACLNTEFSRADVPVEGVLQKVWMDYRPVQQELRRFVGAWFDSGPNVSKLLRSDPFLTRQALNFRAHLIPTKKDMRAWITGPPQRQCQERRHFLLLWAFF